MQLDECVQAAGRARRASSARWSCRCAGPSAASAPSRARPPGRALFGIVQGGDDPALRVRERARAGRHRLPRLRHRRPCGRRAAGRDARGSSPKPTPALPADRPRYLMGVGTPDDLLRGGRARHRHVRLRDADAQRPPRPGLHALRPDQSQERAPRRRSAPARPGKPLSRRRATFRAPICIIWSAAARCSAPCCCRSSISPITRT